jgi:AraC-like DNA-binding protein/mannose-6-phosphate isomerase-like protein (cupin superfamily)
MPKKAKAAVAAPGETEWLGRVREVRHPLDLGRPLRVASGPRILEHGHRLPISIPKPERHPYCEFSFVFEGRYIQFIGTEKVERSPGDLMLLAPGTPHYATHLAFPIRVIGIYFLPLLLFELSPSDGARILNRFTSARSIAQRVVRPPKSIRTKLAEQFTSIADEFDHPRLGSNTRLRSLLMDVLIRLLRWEESAGYALPFGAASSKWVQIEKVLNFIYKHSTEPLYIEQIAREAGVSADDLYRLFRDAFGMSCIQYLRAYRISHAASLLSLPDARVTEIALAVGFETFSHFNASFRRFQGMSPREYMRSHKGADPASA